MSNPPNDAAQQLWDNSQNTVAAGCAQCPERLTYCGGIHPKKPIWSCMDFCCRKPDSCPYVCKAKPEEYVRRLQEIHGYAFEPASNLVGPPCPDLPDFVPVVFHRSNRFSDLDLPAIAVPLRKLFHNKTGVPLVRSKEQLFKKLRVANGSRLVITGVAKDEHIERYWDVGRSADIVGLLTQLKPDLVTVPNYTLYLNLPRFEDMYNLKRIQIVFRELVEAGLPAALHINGRTRFDLRRWADFIRKSPSVHTLAFEFATGTTMKRQPLYAQMLIELRRRVGRPMALVVRGGISVLEQLKHEFERVVFVDTTAFSKTLRRQRATPLSQTRLHWKKTPTRKGECLNPLLAHNIQTYSQYVRDRSAAASRVERKIA